MRDRRPRLRWAAAYTAGALIPLVPVAIWLYVAHVSPGSLVYAVLGFRVDALHALSASNLPLHVRLRDLILPGELSGLFVVLVVAVGGLWTLRRDGVLAVTLVAWLAAGAVGVLGGGSYWPHYLIQLIAPASLLAGAALAGVHRGIRAAAVVAFVAIAVIGTVGAAPTVRSARLRGGVVDVAGYVRTHARPGDTQYVMYAKANAGYYTGLQSPYPYAWSLLVRAHPGAIPRLLHLLQSPRRPTWIVAWQKPNRWHLDPSHAIARALHAHYRVVAHRHGHPIYHVTSSPAPTLPRRSQP